MSRLVNIAGGVVLAFCLSQFPEFSRQYVQRLSGTADRLSAAVLDYDTPTETTGQTREQALALLGETDVPDRRQGDRHNTIERQNRLTRDFGALRNANVYVRLAYIARYPDTEVAALAWNDFAPSVPLTLDGIALTAVGYLAGYGLLGGVFALGRSRRNRRAA